MNECPPKRTAANSQIDFFEMNVFFFISNYESIIKVTNTIINHLSKVASKSDRDFSIFISSNYYVCLRLLLLLLHLLLYHAFHYFQLLLLSGVFFCIQLELDELILVLFVRLKDFCIWTPLYNSHSSWFNILFSDFVIFYSSPCSECFCWIAWAIAKQRHRPQLIEYTPTVHSNRIAITFALKCIRLTFSAKRLCVWDAETNRQE